MKYEIRSMKCMRRCFGLVMVLALTGLAGAWAGEADDHYIEIYKLIREADALNEGGQLSQAQTRYTEALASLQSFRKTYPDWNVLAVNYRLEYLASRIAGLAAKLPAPSAAASTPANAPAAPTGPAPGSAPAPVSADWTNQFNALREQARQLQLEKNQWLADKELLQAKLREALAIQPAASDPRELAKAETKINALQKENDLLSASLERAKAGRSGFPPPSPALTPAPPAEAARPEPPETAAPREPGAASAPSVDAERLKQLEWQRDDLAKKLAAAHQALAARKAKGSLAETQNELNNLRAKLEVLEAQKVPYTAEELALFKPSEPTLAPARTARKPVREVPAGMAALVAQARSYFRTKQYDKAEALYLQILRENEKDVGALSDLAFIEVKLQHFDAAEKHLKTALAIAPDDPYSLMILGRLRMSQTNYDDALQMLSRAAQGDPQNAEIQNELGIVLTEKGQRDAAEAAFRKAILLQPAGYADPHVNLAFFYLTAKPPLVELARWHYQKGLADGALHNPEIEKLFESKKTAAR